MAIRAVGERLAPYMAENTVEPAHMRGPAYLASIDLGILYTNLMQQWSAYATFLWHPVPSIAYSSICITIVGAFRKHFALTTHDIITWMTEQAALTGRFHIGKSIIQQISMSCHDHVCLYHVLTYPTTSPGTRWSTLDPTSTISPTASWPRITSGEEENKTSVWQTPHALILMYTWFSSRGSAWYWIFLKTSGLSLHDITSKHLLTW